MLQQSHTVKEISSAHYFSFKMSCKKVPSALICVPLRAVPHLTDGVLVRLVHIKASRYLGGAESRAYPLNLTQQACQLCHHKEL